MPIPADLNGDPPPLPPDDLEHHIEQAIAYGDEAGITAAARPFLDPDSPMASRAVRWQPTDLAGAEWCARKLAAARSGIDANGQQYAEWKDELDRWLRSANARHVALAALMEEKLERFALDQREAGGPATLKLPSATVRTTAHRDAVVFADGTKGKDDDLTAWAAKHHPELLHRSVLVSEVRGYVDPHPVPTGRWIMELECGCTLTDTLPDEALDQVDADGQVWTKELRVLCPTHRGPAELVVHVEAETELQPLDMSQPADRRTPVPGMMVEPAHVTAKVT